MKAFDIVLISSLCLTLCACGSAQIDPRDISLAPAEVIINPQGKLAQGTSPFQGIPSIATSASGKRQFLVWYGNGKGENADNYLMLSYGEKNFWRDTVDVVIRSPHNGKVRLFDPAAWRDTDGNIWIFWAQSAGDCVNNDWEWSEEKNKRGMWDRRGGVWCIVCKNPDDKIPQWSEPRRLCDGVMMNQPTVLKDGSWAFPVCVFQVPNISDAQSAREGAQLLISRDKGETLEFVNVLKIPFTPFTEHMFVEKRDGTLQMYSRYQSHTVYGNSRGKNVLWKAGGNCGIFLSESTDGGKTFGKIEPAAIPHCGSRFHISRLNSGNLLLLKNDANDQNWLNGNANIPDVPVPPRNCIKAYISKDEGKTWLGGLEIDSRQDVSYPDASQDDKGFIYVTYDRKRYSEREILVAKITENDILNKTIGFNSESSKIVNKAR